MADKLIFLSHIHEEAKLAAVFKATIEDEFSGFVDVFVSSGGRSIPIGIPFLKSIERGLVDCIGAIYLISPTSVRRNWINFELGAVWIRSVSSVRGGGSEIPAIPICHSGCTPSNLPMPLNNLNAILATDPLQLELAFRSIQSVVGGKGFLKTDFCQLASKIAALEEHGSAVQEQDPQPPTMHRRVSEASVVKPKRYYSPNDKDRIADVFHQLREILHNDADPLQREVQIIWRTWNHRQSRAQPGEGLDLTGTIDRMNSIRQNATRLSHKIFDVMLKENKSYEPLLKTVLDYRIPDPLRRLQQHADRLRGALRSAEAIYQESPHQSDKIVDVVVRVLEPFADTNSRLNGWIHDTLRRIDEQEEIVLLGD